MSGERAEMEFCAPYYLLLLQVTRYVVEEQKKIMKKSGKLYRTTAQRIFFIGKAQHRRDIINGEVVWRITEKKTTQNTFN